MVDNDRPHCRQPLERFASTGGKRGTSHNVRLAFKALYRDFISFKRASDYSVCKIYPYQTPPLWCRQNHCSIWEEKGGCDAHALSAAGWPSPILRRSGDAPCYIYMLILKNRRDGAGCSFLQETPRRNRDGKRWDQTMVHQG